MKRSARLIALAAALAAPPAFADFACPPPGAWMDGATGERLSAQAALARLAEADAVLLGESHGYPDVHLWQAMTAAAISAARGGAQYAYEMLPRAAQPQSR